MKTKLLLLAAFGGIVFVSSLNLQAESPGDGSSAGQKEGRDRFWADLGVTEDQKQKMLPIMKEMQEKVRAVRENASLDKDQKREQIRAIRESYKPQINAILTPDQQQKVEARMNERHSGAESRMMERGYKMAEELGLSDEQRAKIQPLRREMMAKVKEVRENKALTKEQKREQIKGIYEAYKPRIDAILTPEQQKKAEEMRQKMREKMKDRKGQVDSASRS